MDYNVSREKKKKMSKGKRRVMMIHNITGSNRLYSTFCILSFRQPSLSLTMSSHSRMMDKDTEAIPEGRGSEG